MKKKQQNIQVILISIGLLLVLITYFYYPYMNKPKLIENPSAKKDLGKTLEDQSTSFENVQYKGQFENQSFTIKSEKASIRDDSDTVFMKNVHMVLYLNDGRIVNITSNEGKYFRLSHDTFFVGDVFATDSETQIFSQNLDLMATKNVAKIYNDVTLNNPVGFLQADSIDYDFETKYYKISSNFDKTIEMKVIK